MVAFFGVAGSVRPGVGGVLSFTVVSLTGLLFMTSTLLLYRSKIEGLLWVADLMEDRVLHAKQNWVHESWRSLVEVGSWLHITFRIHAIVESPVLSAVLGAIAGAFCVVLGETLTSHCRQDCTKHFSPIRTPEIASLLWTPQFVSLAIALILTGVMLHVQESQDLGFALTLTALTNVAYITAEQLLMIWEPTRWAACTLHDRAVNIVHNWQHETIRSGFETSFYLSSIFSCFSATENVIVSVAAGTVAGIVIVLLSSSIGLGEISTAPPPSLTKGPREYSQNQFAFFVVGVSGWAFATLLYTSLVFSRNAILATFVTLLTAVALICVVALPVSLEPRHIEHSSGGNLKAVDQKQHTPTPISTKCASFAGVMPMEFVPHCKLSPAVFQSKWAAFKFTLRALLTNYISAFHVKNEEVHHLPPVRMSQVEKWAQEHGICPDYNLLAPIDKFERLSRREISPEQVKQTKTWVVIEGFVFDVASFAASHPGGKDLLVAYAARGADVTDHFAAFHHPSVYHRLTSLLVGKLATNKNMAIPEERNSERGNKVALELYGKATQQYRLLRSYLWTHGYFDGAESNTETAQAVGHLHVFVLSLGLLAVCQIILLSENLKSNQDLSSFRKYFQCTLAGVTLGFFWQQVGFIAHDAMHNGIVNRTIEKRPTSSFVPHNLLGWLHGSVLFGISSQMWHVEHSGHHAMTIRAGEDPQFNYLPMWAISLKEFASDNWQQLKSSFWLMPLITRTLVSIQHYTLLPLAMLVGRFNFYIINAIFAIKHRIYYDLIGMAFYWTYFSTLVMQLSGHRDLQTLLILSSHWTVGILHVQLLISHLALDTVTVEEEEAYGFFVHQVKTTRDVDTSESFAFLHGGLERQIAHHLWPSLPRGRLELVTPAVKDICRDNPELDYRSAPFCDVIRLCLHDFREIAEEVWAGNIAI